MNNVAPIRRLALVTPACPEPAVYTVGEVAELLALSIGTVYAMLRDGQIPARRVRGKWVISRRRFDAWLDNLPEASTEDVQRELNTPEGEEITT